MPWVAVAGGATSFQPVLYDNTDVLGTILGPLALLARNPAQPWSGLRPDGSPAWKHAVQRSHGAGNGGVVLVADSVTLPCDIEVSGNLTVDGTTNIGGVEVIEILETVPDWVNVTQAPYNADPTGSNDSSAAIQAAINAAAALGQHGGAVYLPPGRFATNTTLVPATGVRIFGDSRTGTKIVSTATGGMFNMGPASTLLSVEIDHLFLSSSVGDIFSGANIERSYFHDNEFQQLSAGKSIWNSTPGPGLMVECIFERNIESIAGNPRTVEAWLLVAPSNSNQVNQNTWRDIQCFNNGADPTFYWYHLQGTTAGTTINDSNVFENMVFETCPGGCVWLESCRGTVLMNCHGWDETGSYAASLFLSTKNANGGTPTQNTFINTGRIGGSLGAGFSDIQLDANNTSAVIIAPRGAQVDLGNSSNVEIIGGNSPTFLNTAGSLPAQYLGGAAQSYPDGVQTDDTSNTNTAASFAAITKAWPLAAGDASAVGTRYKLRCWGTGTWGSTAQVLSMQFVISNNMMSGSFAAAAFAASTAFSWVAECEIVITATGSSGSYTDTGFVILSPGGSQGAGSNPQYVKSDASVGLNTTTAHTFVLQTKWASTTGAPTITCLGSTFERVGP